MIHPIPSPSPLTPSAHVHLPACIPASFVRLGSELIAEPASTSSGFERKEKAFDEARIRTRACSTVTAGPTSACVPPARLQCSRLLAVVLNTVKRCDAVRCGRMEGGPGGSQTFPRRVGGEWASPWRDTQTHPLLLDSIRDPLPLRPASRASSAPVTYPRPMVTLLIPSWLARGGGSIRFHPSSLLTPGKCAISKARFVYVKRLPSVPDRRAHSVVCATTPSLNAFERGLRAFARSEWRLYVQVTFVPVSPRFANSAFFSVSSRDVSVSVYRASLVAACGWYGARERLPRAFLRGTFRPLFLFLSYLQRTLRSSLLKFSPARSQSFKKGCPYSRGPLLRTAASMTRTDVPIDSFPQLTLYIRSSH